MADASHGKGNIRTKLLARCSIQGLCKVLNSSDTVWITAMGILPAETLMLIHSGSKMINLHKSTIL